MNNKLKIAIIDRAEIINDLCSHYQSIFNILGYECFFKTFTDQSQLINTISEENIHMVICDLSLGDTENYKGLNLINSIKTNWPHIICIGNSKTSITYRQTTSKLPNFDLFIDKAKLLTADQIYYDQVVSSIAQILNINLNVRINPRSIYSSLINENNLLELEAILGQVTFTGHPTRDAIKLDDITLTPLTGGRSGSDVYKMEVYSSSSKITAVPSVLKISKIEKAKIEAENFHRFVKWTLPYSWRVDILGTGFTKNFGGICYSFIRSENRQIESLTYNIETKNDRIISSIINQVFSPKMKTWYNYTAKEKNINKRYSERYFKYDRAMTKENNEFMHNVQKYFNGVVRNNSISIDGYVFPHPVDDLFGEPNGDYSSCICHGDLNSNNIIVAPNDQFIFIDFQDTGIGHVFEDFATLEASLRLHYPISSECSPLEILRSEIDVSQNCLENMAYADMYSHVHNIRKLAHENFPMESASNYRYAVAAFHFRLLRIPNLDDSRKIIITAAILSNLRHSNKCNK